MRYCLTAVEGPEKGLEVELPRKGVVVLGRGLGADQRLRDEEISRLHCRIVATPESVMAVDLGSRNGTFLNDRSLGSPAPLRAGDRLRLGNTVLEMRFADPARLAGRPAAALFCLACGEKTGGACPRCGPRYVIPAAELPGLVLERRLGAGGMGAVFLGRHGPEERPVAVKVLAFSGEPGEDRLRRFYREAKIPRALRHANVVEVLDYGAVHVRPRPGRGREGEEPAKAAYIVLEYVDGRDLRDLVRQEGPLEPPQALRLFEQVAAAFEAARAAGVVHRDVKPDNIMLDRRGRVRIMDFGLAKCFEASGLAGLTVSGTAFGTPAYMSPEQVRDAKRADHRSDLYSVGATLYFVLTGRPPFPGRAVAEVLRRVLHEEPAPLRTHRPALPEALDRAVLRCLAKRPEDRFATAAELEGALAALRSGLPPARPAPMDRPG